MTFLEGLMLGDLKSVTAVRWLLNLWRKRFALDVSTAAKQDPLLQLRGSGRHLWATEHADDYVRRLREGASNPE
jgi:hypothetical protein